MPKVWKLRQPIPALVVIGLLALSTVPLAPPAGAEPDLAWSETIISARIPYSSPTVADVDGDGENDVAVGAHDGKVRIFRADGSPLPGWPREVVVRGDSPTAVDASPTVADLDGDGANEVIVGAGSAWVRNQHGGLVVFARDGSVRWRFHTRDVFTAWGMLPDKDGFQEGVFSTPAVGDVDGDGFPDVVFGAWDHRIYALDRNGRLVSGFPYFHDDTISSSPALFDVDGDGRMEIFIGGDSAAGGKEDWAGGVLRALDWHEGRVVEQWKVRKREIFISSPAIGDIDGDGGMELVIGAGTFYKNAASRRVYAFNLEDGSRVSGWPRSTDHYVVSSPALGDLDDDGRLDVIVASKDGKLYAFRGDGTTLWSVDPDDGSGQDFGRSESSPIVADVNGDGRLDVVAMGASAAFAVRGDDGSRLFTFATNYGYLNAAAVGDFGARGTMLVAAGFRNKGSGRVAAFSIPRPGAEAPWPMFRRSADHRGALPGTGDATWSGGLVIATEQGKVLTMGRARHLGNVRADPYGGLVDVMVSADGGGYGLVARSGKVFAKGNFPKRGGVRGKPNVVAAMAHPNGRGYYLVRRSGKVVSRGGAPLFGDAARRRHPGIVDAMVHPSGLGYALVAANGKVFTFGAFPYRGRARGEPVVAAGVHPSGEGYYLLTAEGKVVRFGPIPRFRDAAGRVKHSPFTELTVHAGGSGYWLLTRNGGYFPRGRVPWFALRAPVRHPLKVAGVAYVP